MGLLLQRKWKEREGKGDFWTFFFFFWSWQLQLFLFLRLVAEEKKKKNREEKSHFFLLFMALFGCWEMNFVKGKWKERTGKVIFELFNFCF